MKAKLIGMTKLQIFFLKSHLSECDCFLLSVELGVVFGAGATLFTFVGGMSPPIVPPDTKPAKTFRLLGCDIELFCTNWFGELDDAGTKLLLNCAIIPVFSELTVAERLGAGFGSALGSAEYPIPKPKSTPRTPLPPPLPPPPPLPLALLPPAYVKIN